MPERAFQLGGDGAGEGHGQATQVPENPGDGQFEHSSRSVSLGNRAGHPEGPRLISKLVVLMTKKRE